MQAIKCEMCSSSDLVKQDGLYVCQYCGTKYTVDEARKLLIDGTIDVNVNVKIDDTEETDNLYVLARQARDANDAENAARYYNMILFKKPYDYESIFFAKYYDAMSCSIGKIENAVVSLINNLPTVFANIPEDKTLFFVEQFTHYISELANVMYQAASNNYKEFSSLQGTNVEFISRTAVIFDLLSVSGDYVAAYSSQRAVLLWKIAAEMISDCSSVGYTVGGFSNLLQKATSNMNKIRQYEPSYKVKGACYIATAVYGSYDCPSVWVLRRFRDEFLDTNLFGRLFIKSYYSVSPALIKYFGETEIFKVVCAYLLDRLVLCLRAHGISDAFYIDKY